MMDDHQLDTNILLRLVQPASPQHLSVKKAVVTLQSNGTRLLISTQNLVEFMAVATRPVERNGLGLTYEEGREYIRLFLTTFRWIEDGSDILNDWLSLIDSVKVIGKQVHDARIVAVMLENQITHLLTFDSDFNRFANFITVVSPDDF